MTRMSKQAKRRAISPRRPRLEAEKTGSKKDQLENGYKVHANALTAKGVFFPKNIK